MQGLDLEEVGHFIMVQGVDILVYRVASELHLTEAEVYTGGLTDVHDLPVRGEDEDEPVQGLQEVGAELLEDLVSAITGLHPPTLAQALGEHLAHLEERCGQPDDAGLGHKCHMMSQCHHHAILPCPADW